MVVLASDLVSAAGHEPAYRVKRERRDRLDRLIAVSTEMSDEDYITERDRLRRLFADTLDPAIGSALGWLLWDHCCGASGEVGRAELDEAVEAFAICITVDAGEIPEGLLPRVADAAAPYAAGLLERALDTADPEVADLAVDLWNRIVNILPGQAGYLSRLGVALRVQFERRGGPGQLDLAVRAGELAIIRAAPDDPGRPSYLCNFGVSLSVRHIHGGDPADLADSVRFLRQAAESLPAADLSAPCTCPPSRPRCGVVTATVVTRWLWMRLSSGPTRRCIVRGWIPCQRPVCCPT